MDNKNKSEKSVGFEEKIGRLQTIVEKLENDGNVTLEDSMSLFEQGLVITDECVNELNAMQARIAELDKKLDIILGRSETAENND